MFYTVKQVYDYLNGAIGKDTIRLKMQTGEIPAMFDGKRYITTQKQLEKYIAKKNVEMEIEAERLSRIM